MEQKFPREIKQHTEVTGNKSAAHRNSWDKAQTVLRTKVIAFNAHIRKCVKY